MTLTEENTMNQKQKKNSSGLQVLVFFTPDVFQKTTFVKLLAKDQQKYLSRSLLSREYSVAEVFLGLYYKTPVNSSFHWLELLQKLQKNVVFILNQGRTKNGCNAFKFYFPVQ